MRMLRGGKQKFKVEKKVHLPPYDSGCSATSFDATAPGWRSHSNYGLNSGTLGRDSFAALDRFEFSLVIRV